jgi:hypothetical protein
MKRRACILATLVTTCLACGRTPPVGPTRVGGAVDPASSPPVAVAAGGVPGAPLPVPAPPAAPSPATPLVSSPGDDHRIGEPKSWENLTIFAVTSKLQDDVGPITTLDEALAKKAAAVHEMGGGAQVNTLVIENKGTIPVYVLAGTLVKGGQQDRQIGKDFIVGANQTVPVDAYCVEHGRWTNQRDGVATAGQFGVAGVLTTSDVRAAGQYAHDQGEVWSKVASVNQANKKPSASGTFFATVDAADVTAHRKALTQKAEAFLGDVRPGDDVVGFAYAVDGQVRGVRWFASHKVFELFRTTLLATAAMDAINQQSVDTASGKAPSATPIVAGDVGKFVTDLQEAKVKEEQATPAMNFNVVRESARGYSGATMMKKGPTAPPKPVSTDFTAK